jgi:hypothetical protein
LGRTVEKNFIKHKERNHPKRAAHHSTPALGEIGRTVENTLKTKKTQKRAAHHSILLS